MTDSPKHDQTPKRIDLASFQKGSFKRSYTLNMPAIEEALERIKAAKKSIPSK